MKFFKQKKHLLIAILTVFAFLIFVYPAKILPYELQSYPELQEKQSLIKQQQTELNVTNAKTKKIIDEIKNLPDKEKIKFPEPNTLDWNLHIPSLLVVLEQNAAYFETDFFIDYDSKKTKRNGRLSVLSLPIAVTGEFENIRDYMEFIERVDMINIENFNLTPGEGRAIINVYYL